MAAFSFEVWDLQTGNMVEAFDTEAAALAAVRNAIERHGMKYVEIEFLADFFVDGEKRTASDITRKLLFDACEGLRGRHIKVGDFYRTVTPMPRLIEEFGQLCREAEARGITIAYEMMPFSAIINIEAAHGSPVRAAEAGTVVYAGNELKGYGNLVLIRHAGGWVTAYAHNDEILVRRGQVRGSSA